MRQRINVAPFHRRILPWIFIIVFLAVAPAVVFYTAGYRWNSKKGKVELNGTIIFDSTPNGASVFIDGQPTKVFTPVTIQDMAPGIHQFSVTNSGYHDWQKTLEVRSEHVTFANTITLWKDGQPVLSSTGTTTELSASPDKRYLVEFTSTSQTHAIMRDLTRDAAFDVAFPDKLEEPLRTSWSDDSRDLLVRSKTTEWLMDAVKHTAPLPLPPATYRWMPGDLVGNTEKELLTIHLSDMSVNRTVLTGMQVDASDEAQLRTTTGTPQLVFVSTAQPDRGFILPPGNWTFWSFAKSFTMLRDGERWVSLQEKKKPPEYHSASGDTLRPDPSAKTPRYLLVNGGELWIWDPLVEPQLIYRQSDRIVNAVWHVGGTDIFFATANAVYALNLDPRDGYLVTTLASFDHVADFAATEKMLYVAGTKDGQNGVWSLEIM
jgi:hypothetical protein